VKPQNAYKFIGFKIVSEYINRIGQKIVLHSDARIPFTFKIIDSDEVNMFTLPDGFFYLIPECEPY
jgi:predicted Zn-dependent protease